MNKDLFSDLNNLSDAAPVDEKMLKEVKNELKDLTKNIMVGKMEESKILQESIAEGGPGSPNEAIFNLMEYTNTGIRFLAQKTGQKRKILLRMLNGEIPLPPEVMSSIYDVFKQKNPELFSFEKN